MVVVVVWCGGVMVMVLVVCGSGGGVVWCDASSGVVVVYWCGMWYWS